MRPRRLLSLPLVAWLAGCAGDPAASLDVQFYQCPDSDCGGNSPIVDERHLGHLSETPTIYSPEGFRVERLSKGGTNYRLAVSADRLVGLDGQGHVALQEWGLGGSFIELRYRNEDNTETPYYLFITTVFHNRQFWIGAPAHFWSYRMEWAATPNPAAQRDPVCPDVPSDPAGSLNPQREAVFFEGDLYDRYTKEVTAIGPETLGWFNIACVGSALFKLFANRYTTATGDRVHPTGRLERQVMLKMFTGDYCGTGRPFTQVGEDLAWQNRLDWNGSDIHPADDLPDEPIDYESIWTATGAVCLSSARLLDKLSPADAMDFLDAIVEECETVGKVLDSCDDLDGFPDSWKTFGEMVSANP